MSQTIHQNLFDLHDLFSRDHDRLREQMLARVSSPALTVRKEIPRRLSRFRMPGLVAAAATLLVTLGLIYLVGGEPSVNLVWADTLKQVQEIKSIHFVASNPGVYGNKDVQMEVWWQRPGHYRMDTSNGTVIANNAEARQILEPGNQRLVITKPDTNPGVLGDFSALFTSEDALKLPFIQESKLVKTEPVSYKGESCRKFIFEDAQRRYEFIVDPKVHQIYETNYYSLGQPPRLIYHVEVLEVDKPIAQGLFTIPSGKNVKIEDNRQRSLPAAPNGR